MKAGLQAVAAALVVAWWPVHAAAEAAGRSIRATATPQVTAAAPRNANGAQRASATSIADAIQLLQLGEPREIEVADDRIGREAVEAQLKRSTRVRTTVRAVADLGGDGCKRIEMAFVALDIPVEGPAGQKGLWSVVMQWNLCNGGIPPEPQ